MKYGMLTILEEGEKYIGKTGSTSRRWRVRCDCGTECEKFQSHIKSGATTSCGCYNKKILSDRTYIHGDSKTPEHTCWVNMIARCTKPHHPNYKNYGARGINICERWMIFENFLEDMGRKPSDNLSIDRIDNDGNYESSNCRWTTQKIQRKNQRICKNNTSGHKGVYWYKQRKKWQAHIRVDYKRIHLGYFDTIEEAVAARKEAELKHFGEFV